MKMFAYQWMLMMKIRIVGEEPINIARQLVQNAEKLDMDMRQFAAKALTHNAK